MTTIRLGLTRYGPSAPDTCQFGKYEALTRTGTPVSLTSKDIVSVPLSMLLTSVVPTGRGSGVSPASMRCQPDGPSPASGMSKSPWSMYQLTVSANQVLPPAEAPLTTAGSFCSGVTSSLPATSNTTHGPLDATSVRSLLVRARSIMLAEIAM